MDDWQPFYTSSELAWDETRRRISDYSRGQIRIVPVRYILLVIECWSVCQRTVNPIRAGLEICQFRGVIFIGFSHLSDILSANFP